MQYWPMEVALMYCKATPDMHALVRNKQEEKDKDYKHEHLLIRYKYSLTCV